MSSGLEAACLTTLGGNPLAISGFLGCGALGKSPFCCIRFSLTAEAPEASGTSLLPGGCGLSATTENKNS